MSDERSPDDEQPRDDDRSPGDEQPRDDDRPDESSDDDHKASNRDSSRSDAGSDEPADEEPSEPGDRQPPIGPGSTDHWLSDEPPGSSDSSGGHWLSSLLSLLDSLDRSSKASRSGRSGGGGRFGLDYDLSIGSGLESIDSDSVRDSPNRASQNPRGPDRRRSSSGGRPSRTRRHRSSLSTQHVTTRTYDDQVLVIADVSSVDPESITVGFDDGTIGNTTLVVGVSDRELERIDVPWDRSSVEADARIKNGVLTVTVSMDDGESKSGTADDNGDFRGDPDE
ncbi:Hsp20/alpha crystallin family protein [Halostagnicola bangensis]